MKSKKIIKQILIVFGLMIGALTFISVFPAIASAGGAIGPPDKPEIVAEGSLRAIVLRIVNYFLGFLGLLAVIMVIYGGVTYVTAAGKDEAVGNAKKIIMYALIGIIIILLAFAIVNTVLGAPEGVEPG